MFDNLKASNLEHIILETQMNVLITTADKVSTPSSLLSLLLPPQSKYLTPFPSFSSILLVLSIIA